MTTRRPLSWFLSDVGRKFSFAAVTGASIAFSIARYVPNTILLEKYKNFVHYYRNGQPVDLPKELKDRCQECLNILNISEVQRKLISPFSVFGYDLFHAGSMNSRFGVAIGIPINFTYRSLEDLQKDNIEVNQKQVNWTTEAGQKLADALILPERVQQFAICREILMTQNNKIIYESIYPFVCLFLAYNFSQIINTKLNLYAAPKFLRITLYSIVGTFSTGLYFLMKDMTEVHYETTVDEKLCELGPEYIESGVIFYDKLLQRNRALRELMGSEGQKKYSKLGNEMFGIRQRRMPLLHRKQFFEEKLMELKGEKLDAST